MSYFAILPRTCLVLCLLGLLSNCSSPSLPATTPAMDASTQAAPFPTVSPYSKAEVAKLFGALDYEQDPDSAQHFRLVVPQTWGIVNGVRHLVTPQHPFELRGFVKSKSGPEAEMKVNIIYVNQELSPSDWLTLYLANKGEQVLHERHIAHEGGAIPDVLTVSGQPGQRFISRWLVLKDWAKTGGAHFYMVQASTPIANYTLDMANVFFMAISNFSLPHPTKWEYAEQLRTLVRVVPAKVSTVFPLSWQQQENPASDEHFYQVKLTKDLAGHRIGQVNLMLTAGQSEAEMHRLEEENRQGYQQADHLTFAPAHFAPAPKFSTFDQVFTALTPQTDVPAGTPAQERQVLLARAGTYWVLLENTRFTREAAPEAWAISKRGFEIVQEHLVIKP
jgi:hypothetical protein